MIDHFRRARQTCPIDELEDILSPKGSRTRPTRAWTSIACSRRFPKSRRAASAQTRIDGHSIAEAAARAGIGESDVKVSVHRGLKALAARIRGERPMNTDALIERWRRI